jgi:hypothetical protein
MAELFILVIIIVGFGIMLGWQVDTKRIAYALGWIVFAPSFFLCVARYVAAIYGSLSFAEQLLFIALTLLTSLLVIMALFPKASWFRRLTGALFDLFIFALTLPVRILWRSVRFILARERHVIHLTTAQPVVGRRPPLRQETRNKTDRESEVH